MIWRNTPITCTYPPTAVTLAPQQHPQHYHTYTHKRDPDKTHSQNKVRDIHHVFLLIHTPDARQAISYRRSSFNLQQRAASCHNPPACSHQLLITYASSSGSSTTRCMRIIISHVMPPFATLQPLHPRARPAFLRRFECSRP